MKSFPWDSVAVSIGEDGYPVYDRAYMASDLREVYETFFSNGVFTDSATALKVSPGENMTVKVLPGRCCINGTVGYENEERVLALQASASSDRIDTVVLRWDADIDARSIDLYVKTGAPSDTPVRPTLTRSETVWELGLCDVFVPAHSLTVKAEKVTDTRLETERCGVVAPFVQLNTDNFYDQLMQQTLSAVALAQAAIDGTIAGDLQNQIDGKVKKSGDRMSGVLAVEMNGVESVLGENRVAFVDGDYVGKIEMDDIGGTEVVKVEVKDFEGNYTNAMMLTTETTEFMVPVALASGGTGSRTAAGARGNIGAMAAINKNGFYGLARPDGNDTLYVRTPSNGIIPFQEGGSGTVGTSAWPFNDMYAKTAHITGSKLVVNGREFNSDVSAVSLISDKTVQNNNTASGASVTMTTTLTVANKDKLIDFKLFVAEEWNCGAYISGFSQSGNTVTATVIMSNHRTFTANCSCRVMMVERYFGLVAR